MHSDSPHQAAISPCLQRSSPRGTGHASHHPPISSVPQRMPSEQHPRAVLPGLTAMVVDRSSLIGGVTKGCRGRCWRGCSSKSAMATSISGWSGRAARNSPSSSTPLPSAISSRAGPFHDWGNYFAITAEKSPRSRKPPPDGAGSLTLRQAAQRRQYLVGEQVQALGEVLVPGAAGLEDTAERAPIAGRRGHNIPTPSNVPTSPSGPASCTSA